MASLYDTSATKALNEDAYINKLYDGTLESQKKALQQGYDNSVKQLTTGQDSTKKQTSDYVKRAYVEGQRAAGHVQKPTPKISTPGMGNGGAGAQARLTMANQQQANVSALNNQQALADQEFERQRKVLADKYAAQIKQAQADNDMVRAQALYDAAKAEEEQLRALRESAASLMAGKGDMSITDAIARGVAVTPDTTSPTWDGVLKNEESINKIHDAKMESQRQQAQMEHDESMSKLEAQQKEAQRQTDEALNNAYVEALKKNQNYQEVQNAYGQGSGASMQARLARETGLTEKLTDLRKLQLGKDAKTETDKADLVRALGETISKAQSDIDSKRNKELYEAAEDEEQALIEEQKTVGNLLAKQNNYSVLGALYGLTPDQIHRLQGTGAYAPSYGGGGSGGSYYGGGGDNEESYSGTVGSNSNLNQSTIDLGYGPISEQEVGRLIEAGEIDVIDTDNGLKYIKLNNTPGSTAGAAVQAAIANGGQPLFVSASANKSVAEQIVDAIKNATSSNKTSGGGSSVHTSSGGTTHGGGGGSWGSSTKVDAVTSAAPKASTSGSSNSSSRDTSAYWSTQGSSSSKSSTSSSKSSSSSSKSTSSSSKSSGSSSKSSSSSSSSKSSSSGGSVLGKVTNAIKSWFK